VVANGQVFASDAWGVVSAHDLGTGRQAWRFDTTPEDERAISLGAGVGFADGTLYAATGLAEMIALNAADGTVRWREKLPAPARGAPTIVGGRIFISTTENHLIAMATDGGRRLWTHRGAAAATIPLGLPAPAVEGETVVTGFGTGELVALRATDGRVLWSEALGGLGGTNLSEIVGITGLPVIESGRVIAIGLGNTSVAVDLRSGRRLWERAFGGGNGAAAAGGWVFVVTRAGDALAVGRDDGRIRWVSELDPTPDGGRRGEPARFGPPLLAGGWVMVPSSRGELLTLDPATGAIAGRVPLGYPVTLPMAVAQGTVVALADDGTLLGLRGAG
jgi:outer membrane protein assembly factor BamB